MSPAKGFSAHPAALVESESIGDGTRIWAFAHVCAGAKIGRGCNLGEGVYVEAGVALGDEVTVKNGVAIYEGVTIEDSVFIGPHAVFTNDIRPRSGRYKRPRIEFRPTRIGRGASIGANATIVCGHTVGEFAMIAAGSVVTKDVPPHALFSGVPARPAGFVCECGASLDATLKCRCGLAFRPEGRGLARL